jgi:hypothetical protein
MKKETMLFLVLGLLLIALGVVVLLTMIFRANAPLLRHKLKLGLLIISLQAMIYGCGSPQETTGVIECYAKPIEPDMMSLVCLHYENGVYLYDLSENNTLQVNVSNRQSSAFSYALVDTSHHLYEIGALHAKDLTMNNDWEELVAVIDKNLTPGEYQLRVYNVDSSMIHADTRVSSQYSVKIIRP